MRAFLDLLEPNALDRARAIVADWESRPKTWVSFGIGSLPLYCENHRVPQQRCNVASLYKDQGGTLWMNSGRLEESGAFAEPQLKELQLHIARHLPPTTTAGGKGYYLAFPLPLTDPAEVATLFDWILEVLHSPAP